MGLPPLSLNDYTMTDSPVLTSSDEEEELTRPAMLLEETNLPVIDRHEISEVDTAKLEEEEDNVNLPRLFPTCINSGETSRPRSPSVFSESTKPDPPSVIDHQVLDDDDDEELRVEDFASLEDEEGEAHLLPTPRIGSTNRLQERNSVDGRILQKALAYIDVPHTTDDDEGADGSVLFEDDEADLVPSEVASLPVEESGEEQNQLASKPQEPPVVDARLEEVPHQPLEQPDEGTNDPPSRLPPFAPDPAQEDSSSVVFVAETTEDEEENVKSEHTENVPAQHPVMEISYGGDDDTQVPREGPTNGQAGLPRSQHGELQRQGSGLLPTSSWHTPSRSLQAERQPVDDSNRRAVQAASFLPNTTAYAPTPAFGPAPTTFATPYPAPFATSTTNTPYMMMGNVSVAANGNSGGRRKIHLRLREEVQSPHKRPRSSFLGHIRRRSSRMLGVESSLESIAEQPEFVSLERGLLSVSWFVGTSAVDLQEHVRKSVLRKLRLPPRTQLIDLRLLDESMSPPEEIVLSPHIPDRSQFTLSFALNGDGASTPGSIGRPPDSPSAAPTQTPLTNLNATQLVALTQQLSSLRLPSDSDMRRSILRPRKSDHLGVGTSTGEKATMESKEMVENGNAGANDDDADSRKSEEDDMLLHTEDPIEARLREITELLINDRQRKRGARQEKKQVIFVLANYFILFSSMIVILAELQARAPRWLQLMESQMKDVRDCAANQDALFECVSRGDFAGLVASVILWLSRSVTTRRLFLFGFESPKKLWTVVYESLVTAFCWGFSYLFIRRGMNVDTRRQFLQKYWKDAVYGSLAGFNAAFMKQVLKNLIPQEAVEGALRDRQLKILSWLPSFE